MELKLFDYQKQHVKNIEKVFETSWFCLDTSLLGLGKTYSAAQISTTFNTVIVVAPLSVGGKWKKVKETYGLGNIKWIETFNGIRSVTGKHPKHELLCRYDSDGKTCFKPTKKLKSLFYNEKTVLFVIDEIQNIKNESAQFLACAAIADEISQHNGSKVLCISGSPIDKPIQAYRLFRFFRLDKESPEPKLGCCPELLLLRSKMPELNGHDYAPFFNVFKSRLFKDHYIRRMPIPNYKTNLTIQNAFYPIDNLVDLTQLQNVVQKFQDLNFKLNDQNAKRKDKILRQIMVLMQKIEHLKSNTMISIIKKRLEQYPKEKVVLLFNYTDNVCKAVSELKEYNPIMINGTTNTVKRQERLGQFQEPNLDHRLLIGNLSVLSTGIDLDDKDGRFPRFCLANPMLNAITLYQLGHRFRRIDTKSDAIVQFMFSNDYYANESFLLSNLLRKKDVLEGVADDQKAMNIPFPGSYPSVYIDTSPLRLLGAALWG